MIRIRNPTQTNPENDSPLTKGGIAIGMKREGAKERIYYISEDSLVTYYVLVQHAAASPAVLSSNLSVQ